MGPEKTTPGSVLGGKVFDIAQILAYLVLFSEIWGFCG